MYQVRDLLDWIVLEVWFYKLPLEGLGSWRGEEEAYCSSLSTWVWIFTTHIKSQAGMAAYTCSPRTAVGSGDTRISGACGLSA